MDKNPFKLNNLLKNPVTKFVINFNEHSSDSEGENEDKTVSSVRRPSESPSINLATRSNPTPSTSTTSQKDEPDKVIAYKMQAPTIKNLLDKNQGGLRIRLQETDQHYNRIKKLITKKNLNVQQMKSRIVQGQLKLRKQQAQVRKLQNLYETASKEMKENMKEISALTNSLSTVQRGIESDKKLMLALEAKSRGFEKLLETNLKELSGQDRSDNQRNEPPTTDQDADSMSLASSDEQQLNLILEHNDTSVDRRESLFESLFVQSSGTRPTPLTWPEEPEIARQRSLPTILPSTSSAPPIRAISTNLISQPTLITAGPSNQIRSNLITVPITHGLASNVSTSVTSSPSSSTAKLDDTSIAKIIDLKLDYTRKTSKNSAKKVTLVSGRSIQSPTIKKRPLNKKKNELLRKMLMIEERNEKEEIERAKKEEENKKKLLEKQKENELNELRQMLKNKKILSNAIISMRKDIRNQLKLNDKIENYDLFVNGLTLFLENSLDKSFLLDNLTIKIDHKLFDANSVKPKKAQPPVQAANSDHSIYSNNLAQSSSESPDETKSISPNQDGSVLESIRAYRLSNNFEERYIKRNGQDFTMVLDSFFANKVNPYSATCNFDLNGKCNDDHCKAQHRDDFILDQRQKIIDLLLYNPSIARYKGDVKTKEDMNGLLRHLNKFVDNLEKKYNHNEMVKYLVKLIRISAEGGEDSIITKTKIQMQQTENTTINEFISTQQTQQVKKNGENTFPDFVYKFKIRDRDNVLTYSKVVATTKQLDAQQTSEEYENNYKQRFFSANDPEANLEEYCDANPTDVRSWIKLAYLQINSIHCKATHKKEQLQAAVKVVVRALNVNRRNVELWRTYLYLLINLWNYTKNEDNFEKIEKQLQFICKKILEQYPCYEIWKFYLSFSLNYLNKELISSEILDEIQNNRIAYYDAENNKSKELISNAYLEMVLYKANLYIAINKQEKAKNYLASVLSSSIEPVGVSEAIDFIKTLFDEKHSALLEDRKKYQETVLLTNEDKVFLWLNYLYLIYHGRLPSEKFEQFKQSFSSLSDKKPFLISFSPLKKSGLEKLTGILIEAIKDCFFNIDSSFMEYHRRAQEQIKMQMQQQNLITCLPLFHNLANLLYSVGKKKTAHQVFDSLATTENQILIPLLINKSLFEERNDYANEALFTLGSLQIEILSDF